MPHSKLHYRPAEGYFGDTIPFYSQGQYHLFYLQGQVDPWRRVKYTPYCHLVSMDLVDWEELPVALPLGGPDDADMSLGTGTIIERQGLFYLLYCGRVYKGDRGSGDPHWERTAYEAVCLATSPDLIHWTKDPSNPILRPDGSRYATSDFRDPFPFWNEEDRRYWMLIASLVKGESQERAAANPGALALAVSLDLRHWELRPPFLSPNMSHMALECPDIFQAGGRWYLYFSCDGGTIYRFAERLEGPWQRPVTDPRDHWNLYAAKTLSDGKRRLLFGWIATKAGERDDGEIEWGGDALIPRQLTPLPDGSLAETWAAEVLAACGAPAPFELDSRLGKWLRIANDIQGEREDGLAYAVLRGLPERLLLEASLEFGSLDGSAGIMLRARPDLKAYYALLLDPGLHRVAVERWPHLGEQAFLVERPLDVGPGKPVRVRLFLDGDILEAFVNEKYAMACRLYDYRQGELGLISEYGGVAFRDLSIRGLPG